MNETQLMAAVVRGDQSAYQTLVRAHLPAITRYALRLLGTPRDTEDIAQETFLRLWTTAVRWDPEKAKLTTWLHRITHNLCVDHLRRHKRVSLVAEFDEQPRGEAQPYSPTEPALHDALFERASDQPTDQEALETKAEHDALEHALMGLPEAQRSALLLCYFQGFSNKETAAIMALSVTAVESLIARAKRGLRATMEADTNAENDKN